jgi:starch synthase
MKIAFAASEVVPFSKTGGLADVAGSLPKALEKLGCEVKIFTPKYSSIDEDSCGLEYCWDVGEMPIRVAGLVRTAHVHRAKLPNSNVEVNFIDCPHYYFRGRIYTTDPDEDERFILFCKGVIETMQRLKWVPDIVHCNDWQTGLLPLYLKDNYGWDKAYADVKSLFTIHNIAYQGKFPQMTMFNAEINGDYFYKGGPVEDNGSVNFMKTALSFSDIINTVSKTYAKEILTPEFGAGMETILDKRSNDLYGILNGVDYTAWNPEHDKHIRYHYSLDDMSGKLDNKKFLMERFALPFDEKLPLIGIVSRLAGQKGFDIISEAALDLMELPAQWIILGNGDDKYEAFFKMLTLQYPDKVASYIGFNNELSHWVEAGSDIFLMPSHYEPCGLNQIYSLKYGTVPVVRKTGGLADTVHDWDEYQWLGEDSGTGFSFNDYTPYALVTSLQRAIKYFHEKEIWNIIQRNGMMKNYSWETSAKEYIELYRKALK